MTAWPGSQELGAGAAGLVLFDGESGKMWLSRAMREIGRHGSIARIEHRTDAPSLHVESELEPKGAGLIWRVKLLDTGRKRGLIEVRLGLPVKIRGEWTHVAATYDNQTARVFIDAKLAGERKLNVPMPTLGGTYQLGRSGHGYPFIGLVRDVKVSNYCKIDLDVR